MASIDRTAYPRFQSSLTASELQTLYRPSDEELRFVVEHARGDAGQLTLLTLLKCHQYLGYTPSLTDVPSQIRTYLSQQLHLPADTALDIEAEKTLYRYRQLIRTYLDVSSYSLGGAETAQTIVEQAAYSMSDPADLINVAIEHLVEQRFELPAFSTLDRLVGRIRHQVHGHLYEQITRGLTPTDIGRLEGLLSVREGRTSFSQIKTTPRGASLQYMRQWSERLDWLESILTTSPLLSGIANTKVEQFAAEAKALDALDMRRIQTVPRRRALLVCMLHQTQVQTRDQLAEMLVKRMRRTRTLAREKLKQLQDQHRELEEHMLAVFADVIDETLLHPEDNAALGQGVRDILKNDGGAEALRERYELVSAYHNDNYRPLMWTINRQYRAALFGLSRRLSFRSATQDDSLINALEYIRSYQRTRRDYLPGIISLEFASVRWQALVKSRQKMETVLDRRQLETCVFYYLARGLQSGDVYVLGAKHVRYGKFGGIAYHHISDTYIALFSHFIACGMWEAVYILDGLLKNKSELQPDTLHADTHGQSEPVFGLASLLGIKLMPRMRTWNDVTLYRVDHRTTYKHIDRLLTQVIDWDLIERHWQDMMQVVLSIQAGKVLPSMLMQRLGVYSRKNNLYKAFSELGRVERTIFLLEYMSDTDMRQQIRAETTKVESYNMFTDWLAFGGPVLRTGDPVEQEKRIKYRDLVANVVMLQNVVDMTNVFHDLQRDGVIITPELVAGMSPYLTEHLKRFGRYDLDMAAPPEPLEPKPLFVKAA